MADLKRLAMGRKAYSGSHKAASKGGAKMMPPSKPAKKLEETCAEEIGELEAAFRERTAKEDKRKRLATDSEFWFAVYFPTREDKHEFLRKYGLDKVGDKYLSGEAADRVLGSRQNGRRDGHTGRR